MAKNLELIDLRDRNRVKETIDVNLPDANLTVTVNLNPQRPRSHWRDYGNCRNRFPDKFLPVDSNFEDRAADTFIKTEICLDCPVRVDCLETGLTTDVINQADGYWGGLHYQERLQIAQQRESETTLESTIESQLSSQLVKDSIIRVLKALTTEDINPYCLRKLVLEDLAIDLAAINDKDLNQKFNRQLGSIKQNLKRAGLIELVKPQGKGDLISLWRLTDRGQEQAVVDRVDFDIINRLYQQLEPQLKLLGANVGLAICQILTVMPDRRALSHQLKQLTLDYMGLDRQSQQHQAAIRSGIAQLAKKGYLKRIEADKSDPAGIKKDVYQLIIPGQKNITVPDQDKQKIEQLYQSINRLVVAEGDPPASGDDQLLEVENALIEIFEVFPTETIDDQLLLELVADNLNLESSEGLVNWFNLARHSLLAQTLIEPVGGGWRLIDSLPGMDLISLRQEALKKINIQTANLAIMRVLSSLPDHKVPADVLRILFIDTLVGVTAEEFGRLGLRLRLNQYLSSAKYFLSHNQKLIQSQPDPERSYFKLWSITSKGRRLYPRPTDCDRIERLYRQLMAPSTAEDKQQMLARIPTRVQLRQAILSILSVLDNHQAERKILNELIVDHFQIDRHQLDRVGLTDNWNRLSSMAKLYLVKKQLIDNQNTDNRLGVIYRLTDQARPTRINAGLSQRIRHLYHQIKHNLLAEVTDDLPSTQAIEQLILIATQRSSTGQISTTEINWLIKNYFDIKPQSAPEEQTTLSNRARVAKRRLIADRLIRFQRRGAQVGSYRLAKQGHKAQLEPRQEARFDDFINQIGTQLAAGHQPDKAEIAGELYRKFNQNTPEDDDEQVLPDSIVQFVNQINQPPIKESGLSQLAVSRSLIRIIRSLPDHRVENQFIFDLVAFDLACQLETIKADRVDWSISQFYGFIQSSKNKLSRNQLLTLDEVADQRICQLTPLAQRLLKPDNPRAEQIRQHHKKLQLIRPLPDTLEVAILKVLNDAKNGALPADEVCRLVYQQLMSDIDWPDQATAPKSPKYRIKQALKKLRKTDQIIYQNGWALAPTTDALINP